MGSPRYASKLVFESPRLQRSDSQVFGAPDLRQPSDRWQYLAEQAGTNLGDVYVVPPHSNPMALESGMPSQLAERIKTVHLPSPEGDEDAHALPLWLNAVCAKFKSIEHLHVGGAAEALTQESAAQLNDVMAATPAADARLRRLYVLFRLPQLKSIDGTPVSFTERVWARPGDRPLRHQSKNSLIDESASVDTEHHQQQQGIEASLSGVKSQAGYYDDDGEDDRIEKMRPHLKALLEPYEYAASVAPSSHLGVGCGEWHCGSLPLLGNRKRIGHLGLSRNSNETRKTGRPENTPNKTLTAAKLAARDSWFDSIPEDDTTDSLLLRLSTLETSTLGTPESQVGGSPRRSVAFAFGEEEPYSPGKPVQVAVFEDDSKTPLFSNRRPAPKWNNIPSTSEEGKESQPDIPEETPVSFMPRPLRPLDSCGMTGCHASMTESTVSPVAAAVGCRPLPLPRNFRAFFRTSPMPEREDTGIPPPPPPPPTSQNALDAPGRTPLELRPPPPPPQCNTNSNALIAPPPPPPPLQAMSQVINTTCVGRDPPPPPPAESRSRNRSRRSPGGKSPAPYREMPSLLLSPKEDPLKPHSAFTDEDNVGDEPKTREKRRHPGRTASLSPVPISRDAIPCNNHAQMDTIAPTSPFSLSRVRSSPAKVQALKAAIGRSSGVLPPPFPNRGVGDTRPRPPQTKADRRKSKARSTSILDDDDYEDDDEDLDDTEHTECSSDEEEIIGVRVLLPEQDGC